MLFPWVYVNDSQVISRSLLWYISLNLLGTFNDVISALCWSRVRLHTPATTEYYNEHHLTNSCSCLPLNITGKQPASYPSEAPDCFPALRNL